MNIIKGEKMNPDSMFAVQLSENENYATPLDFFKKLDKEFHFTLDPCSDDLNYKCTKHYTRFDDGLSKSWENETVFMTPPYGRIIPLWVEKAYKESKKHQIIIVGLLPARIDTKWFHDFCLKSCEIRFIKGRLKFGDSGQSAPFANILVIWDGIHEQPFLSSINAK